MEIRKINPDKIKKQTKVFFHSQTWKNILVFFVFVVLAFCFWTMQYFQQRTEREIVLPIQYINIPKQIILSNSTPNNLTVKIADKGVAFLKYHYNTPVIEIDLKKISEKDSVYTISHSGINSKISDVLSGATQLISFSPDALEIRYALLKKKEVPVRINGKITPASGYMFTDSLHIEPASVFIYGDKANLDSLQHIFTKNINQENIKKDLDIKIKLETPQGIHVSQEEVKISSTIEEYTEKIFELPIICHNVPEKINVRFFPSVVEVNCHIALSKYSQLTENDLAIDMDYNTLVQNQGSNLSIDLTTKPEWLINYRLTPSTVEYLFEQI